MEKPERNNYKTISNYLLTLQRVDSLEKMDEFVQELTEAIGDVYSCISCKTGCYTCCTGASMPTVYAKEWQRVREYIKKMPQEMKNIIKENAQDLIDNHGELIQFVDEVIHQTSDIEDLSEIANKINSGLQGKKCPLHINGKCSVYEVRPTKCRIFGYFGFIFDEKVQFLSCISDNEKMQAFIAKNNTKQVVLPYWNSVERKLINFVLDSSENFDMTIIPLWLKNDLENDFL